MIPSIYQSFLFAHLIGLFLVILSIVILFRLKFYEDVFKTAELTPFSLFYYGVLLILIGMIFVHFHNVWVFKPRLTVTIFAWTILVTGILLVVFPNKAKAVFYRWTKMPYLKTLFISSLILGLVILIDSIRLVIHLIKTQNIYAHLLSGFQQVIA